MACRSPIPALNGHRLIPCCQRRISVAGRRLTCHHSRIRQPGVSNPLGRCVDPFGTGSARFWVRGVLTVNSCDFADWPLAPGEYAVSIGEAMRWMLVAIFILVAAALHYVGGPVPYGIGLWFLLAVGIGFLLGNWWVLAFAPVPWLLGVGGGLVTGRYAYLGEFWQFIFLLSAGTGLIGISLGLSIHAATARWTAR